MSWGEQIVSDLTAAMKAQDAQRTSTMRMVKAAMMNRKIEQGNELTDEDVQKLLRSLVKQRRDSFEQYEKAGRQELVDKEAAEIAVIEASLPQAASAEEIGKLAGMTGAKVEDLKAISGKGGDGGGGGEANDIQGG
jgi:hypothetical protein